MSSSPCTYTGIDWVFVGLGDSNCSIGFGEVHEDNSRPYALNPEAPNS